MNQLDLWPPNYKIRFHRKAKRVKLKVSYADGLEITLPPFFNKNTISSILEENKDWIIGQLFKLKPINNDPPQHIIFHLTNEIWKINYELSTTHSKIVELGPHEIMLQGNIHNHLQCKKVLITWIKKKSAVLLTDRLKMLSEITTISYKKLSIRQQKYRWGSCSSEQNINLNFKLIFLPQHLTDHVIIHELCHIKYLNHSRKFWSLVEKYDPNYNQHRKELKKTELFLPDWLL